MDARNLIAAALTTSISMQALAQTQPTRPSAYPTVRTIFSAFPTAALSPCFPLFRRSHYSFAHFNPTSPCYSGTIYPYYSALSFFEMSNVPRRRAALQGADQLSEAQATSRIEAKGYSNVSGLQKDNHGIWRGEAIMKDGKHVEVILDLEGNIYSELAPRVEIWIRPLGQ